jgi:hypothetical protein
MQPLELLGINNDNSNNRKLDIAMNTGIYDKTIQWPSSKIPQNNYFLALGIPVIDDFFREIFSHVDAVLHDLEWLVNCPQPYDLTVY